MMKVHPLYLTIIFILINNTSAFAAISLGGRQDEVLKSRMKTSFYRHSVSTPTEIDENKKDSTTIHSNENKVRNIKYDLGLGKNLPIRKDRNKNPTEDEVIACRTIDDPKDDDYDIDEITRYMIGHESVRFFPSPLKTEATVGTAPEHDDNNNNCWEEVSEDVQNANKITFVANDDTKQQQKKKKSNPRVNPVRMSEDVIVIIEQQHHDPQQQQHEREGKGIMNRGSNVGTQTVAHLSSTSKIDPNTVWVEMLIHNQRR